MSVRSAWGTVLLALVAWGPACAPPPGAAAGPASGPPTASGRRPANTVELQALARAEEQRFARAVAAEPAAARLEVAAVSPEVLVDPGRRLVYALQPELVALDLATGVERWRLADASGGTLWRSGRSLVVLGAESPVRPRLTFVDPDAPRRLRTCRVQAPAPREAEIVSVLPFDRAGRGYLYWRSDVPHRPQGVPPSEEQRHRARAAEACGIVALDPRTCAVTATPLRAFLLSPPRDDGAAVPIAADDCRYLSPERHMPAVAASVVRPFAQPAPGRPGGPPALRLVTVEVPDPGGGCLRIVKVTLEARDAGGTLLWRRALPDRTTAAGCPPPPGAPR